MIKRLPSNVNPRSEKIILIDGGKATADETNIAQCFNTYFLDITELLRLNVPDNNDRLRSCAHERGSLRLRYFLDLIQNF